MGGIWKLSRVCGSISKMENGRFVEGLMCKLNHRGVQGLVYKID